MTIPAVAWTAVATAIVLLRTLVAEASQRIVKLLPVSTEDLYLGNQKGGRQRAWSTPGFLRATETVSRNFQRVEAPVTPRQVLGITHQIGPMELPGFC